MESKVNYTIVGLFVVILTAALLVFAYWLTKTYGELDYDIYHVHLSESVAGLTADSAVKYRGVDVGTVTQIGINPDNPEEVRLVLQINRGTRIKTDTTASMNFYGITGIAYIELEGEDKDAPLLTSVDGSIPVIPSRPSTFRRIELALDLLAEKSAQTLDNINRLLSDENLQIFQDLLIETRSLAQDLRLQLANVQQLIDNGVAMESDVSEASRRVSAASTSIKQLADGLAANSTRLSRQMSSGMQDSFNALDRLLNDLDVLTVSLQATIEEIRTSPADLLMKRSQSLPGPGEEGYDEK